MSIDNGGQAFPVPCCPLCRGHIDLHDKKGMSLRDYFAAKAMNGMLNDYDWETERFVEKLAVNAYLIADEMLKARNQVERV